ncbi:hypothetical protein AX16_007807 [Volvariella volvacea WC 439]|nr:hypothetical protein AX16_007807 [Volvariella volvacea WC 439]
MDTLTPDFYAHFAGPVLLAYLFNWGLHGILTVQIYNYYIAFPNDLLWCQILVYGVYIVESIQTIIVTHDAFSTFASGFGNPETLSAVHLTWLTVPIAGGLVSFIAKSFYAYRISILAGTPIVGAIVEAIALISSSCAIVAGVLIHAAGDLRSLSQTGVFVTTGVWLAGSATTDVVITCFMIYFLTSRDTGFRNTHLLITKVIRVTVETNAVTAVVAIVSVVLFLHLRHFVYHVTPTASLTKLYANTLFVIFNDRIRIVGGRNNVESDAEQTSSSWIWQNPEIANTTTFSQRRQRTNVTKRSINVQLRNTRDDAQVVALDGINVRTDREVWSDDLEMRNISPRKTTQEILHEKGYGNRSSKPAGLDIA